MRFGKSVCCFYYFINKSRLLQPFLQTFYPRLLKILYKIFAYLFIF